MKITKNIEWDMGHRVTNHESKCRNLHGHRYKVEICLEGNLIDLKNDSSEGMVIDFGHVKKIANKYIFDRLDHRFMVWKKDKLLMNFFIKHKELKHVSVPFVPTAENIAEWIFSLLDSRFKDTYHTQLKLYSITLWETPTSTAICTREDIYERHI